MWGFYELDPPGLTDRVHRGCSTSTFTVNEEIVLSEVGCALPNSGRPCSHTVYSDLSRPIDTDGIEIESFEGDTRELDEPFHGPWLPNLQG